MSSAEALGPKQRTEQSTQLLGYVSGFIMSLLLTLAAFGAVEIHLHHSAASRMLVIGSVVALAVVQFIVQLVLFLHLGRERKPRWKLVAFAAMLLVVGILVSGSLWIMYNLNYRMTPEQITQYMNSQDGL